MDTSEKIERFYNEEHHFSAEVGKLRELALKTGLEETYKWMFPTYTLASKNVLAICKFKNHFGVWFFNGVFLKDERQVLENAQEGKTQAMRHWKFHAMADIDEKAVLGYMQEAIENQKNGRVLVKTKKKATKNPVPKLLKEALAKDNATGMAFKKLSISSQNEYSEYIATAKRETTKHSRLEKILPMIAEGKGLNDKYK